ncbi:GNAT family N-acetyltransferase [Lacticaseibacillus jixiensis]|uniref:GNAT family N-acetyltransferase n=1 Tax=Lacticaseibacillus jixiensis TaxID=3231926 RepID=UPI0036F3C58A
MIDIQEYLSPDRSALLPLLLIGDEDARQVALYIDSGRAFVAKQQDTIIGVVLVITAEAETIEIKNLAVTPDLQGTGIGTALVEFVDTYYAHAATRVIVGTGDADVQNILFYLKRGFRFYAVKHGFFAAYATPIVANGVTLQDMVMLEKSI